MDQKMIEQIELLGQAIKIGDTQLIVDTYEFVRRLLSRYKFNDSQKECVNHCPKCDAGENYIDWGEKDWSDETGWQNANCNRCGCDFSEVYVYSFSEIDTSVNAMQDIPEE